LSRRRRRTAEPRGDGRRARHPGRRASGEEIIGPARHARAGAPDGGRPRDHWAPRAGHDGGPVRALPRPRRRIRGVIRVLIADDHAVVRRGLRQILEGAPGVTVAGEASTAPEVLALVEERRWDVVVLDLSLPGASGLDLLAEIKRQRPDLPVLILTVHSEAQYAVRALRAGASGYLTKESAPEQLVEAVPKTYRGGKYVSAALAERLAFSLGEGGDKAPHELPSAPEQPGARPLASAGKTVSEVAEGLGLSVKTISTYRTRILDKMDMRTNAELTHYAIRNRLVE